MIKMKNATIIALYCMVIISVKLDAQTNPSKFEIGFNLNQFQRDYGLGVHLISPYFFNSTSAVRVGANFQWLEYFNGTETVWNTYQSFQAGFRGRSTIVSDKIYIYGEGGFVILLPNSEFSTESVNFGGYGLFGFEFKPASKFAYFIELGGMGSGAVADKVGGKPIYSNGFITTVGFRVGI